MLSSSKNDCELPLADSCLDFEKKIISKFQQKNQQKVVIFWRSAPCLVVSKKDTHLPGFSQAAEAMSLIGRPVFTRSSGGSAVEQGPGYLNVSCISSRLSEPSLSIEAVYQYYCDKLLAALRSTGLQADVGAVSGAYCDGSYNINVAGQKVVGTAQRRTRDATMFQAVFAINNDNCLALDNINRFYAIAGSDAFYEKSASASLSGLLGGVDDSVLFAQMLGYLQDQLCDSSTECFMLGV